MSTPDPRGNPTDYSLEHAVAYAAMLPPAEAKQHIAAILAAIQCSKGPRDVIEFLRPLVLKARAHPEANRNSVRMLVDAVDAMAVFYETPPLTPAAWHSLITKRIKRLAIR